MSISDDQMYLDYLCDEVDRAESVLFFAVADACPGDHKAARHCDRQPPWCPHCGRTDRGERVTNVDQ